MDDYDFKTTRVVIFGEEYVLKSHEADVYAQEIAGYVDRKMKQIAKEMNIGDPAKIAMMASLDIADRLLRLRSNRDTDQGRANEAILRLGQVIDGIQNDGEAA